MSWTCAVCGVPVIAYYRMPHQTKILCYEHFVEDYGGDDGEGC
jgi:hypothetical protein